MANELTTTALRPLTKTDYEHLRELVRQEIGDPDIRDGHVIAHRASCLAAEYAGHSLWGHAVCQDDIIAIANGL